MRHATTTALVTVGVVAIGVLVLNALGTDATAEKQPPTNTTPNAAPDSSAGGETDAPSPATPTGPTAETTDTTPFNRVHVPAIQTRAVDPGMVLSGEHVVTSAEVFDATENPADDSDK
jgi:hypothetical protein